jgi:predicted RNase H-like nuclease (RuvC/YqgF family)
MEDKTAEQVREETKALIKEAMEADAKIDSLKAQLNEQLANRSEALGKVNARGVKKFAWQGLGLTIFRKGDEGLWSLRGKRQDTKDVFSVD